MRVLILSGYGVFGGRLATLLSDLVDLDLVIAGGDLRRARAFCAAWKGRGRIHPLALDRSDIVAGLLAEAPDLVVDASGPFQDYGEDGYGVNRRLHQCGRRLSGFRRRGRFRVRRTPVR